MEFWLLAGDSSWQCLAAMFGGIGSAGHAVSHLYRYRRRIRARVSGDDMRKCVNALFAAVACCCCVPSVAAERLQFDLQQRSLTAALKEWADLSAFQLVYLAPDVTKELQAPSLRGLFTPREALELLLHGSPLKYEFVNDRTVVVQVDTRGPRSAVGQQKQSLAASRDSGDQ
jgi:hypothetical protein